MAKMSITNINLSSFGLDFEIENKDIKNILKNKDKFIFINIIFIFINE